MNKRSLILVLGTLYGILALQSPCGAELLYNALGASDAVGIGATSPGANGQPNNGYVYVLDTWLNARYSHWTLQNRGVEGYTAPQILQYQLSPTIAAQPDLVTLWAGGNDVRAIIRDGKTVADLTASFAPAFNMLIRRLRKETKAFIVTANLPDLSRIPSAILFTSAQKTLAHDGTLAVNAAIASSAETYNVPVIDLYSDSQSYSLWNFWIDGFHPNDNGYALMASKYEAVLQADAWSLVSGNGDVDGDGDVDARDAGALLGIVAGTAKATDRQHAAGDVTPRYGVGKLGVEDAVGILRMISGLSV